MLKPEDKLVIIWTSKDKEVAEKMIFMYAHNAKINNWWEDIKIIIWGPSAQLLCSEISLQIGIDKLLKAGVQVTACKECADSYQVSELLENMGIMVYFVGKELTDLIKQGCNILTV